MQLSLALGLKVMLHHCNLIKITTPVFRSPSNLMDMLKVAMVGVIVGVLDGVGITATLESKQIKSFIQLA